MPHVISLNKLGWIPKKNKAIFGSVTNPEQVAPLR
jgi:hypothetical protein